VTCFTVYETLTEGLADAVEAGLTKMAGVSNYNVGQMRRAHEALARCGVPLASNQVEYSLLQRQPESSGLLDLCRELGVTLIAYSPLGMGMMQLPQPNSLPNQALPFKSLCVIIVAHNLELRLPSHSKRHFRAITNSAMSRLKDARLRFVIIGRHFTIVAHTATDSQDWRGGSMRH